MNEELQTMGSQEKDGEKETFFIAVEAQGCNQQLSTDRNSGASTRRRLLLIIFGIIGVLVVIAVAGTCTLAINYTARKESDDVDECVSSPCKNSGYCIDELNKFTCLCPPGFHGPTCGVEVRGCVVSLLQHKDTSELNGCTVIDEVGYITSPGFPKAFNSYNYFTHSWSLQWSFIGEYERLKISFYSFDLKPDSSFLSIEGIQFTGHARNGTISVRDRSSISMSFFSERIDSYTKLRLKYQLMNKPN